MNEYVGLDVSKQETSFCIVDERGKILCKGKASSDPASLFEALRDHALCPERIVLETGTLSSWLARGLREYGLPVDVIDARQAHGVLKLQHNKNDANDAALLAEIARCGFCRPVCVVSEESSRKSMLLKARALLVKQQRDICNSIRGLLAAQGIRLEKGTGLFAKRVRAALVGHDDLAAMISPLLCVLDTIRQQLAKLDALVMKKAKADEGCQLLMTIPGVGPVTAIAFVATIDAPERFASSRDVGAYAGLTSRRYQSGEMDYSGRISKFGDAMLRSLLYEAANSMLTVVKKSHPLKDWARKVRKRSCHKKACVALARKLAVIMHKMLLRGEAFRWPAKEEGTATA